MLRWIKPLHIIGFGLFFGSILGHAVGGLADSVHSSPETERLAREIIDVATWYLTVPGLALVTLSGIAMAVMYGKSILEMCWMMAHLVIGALILFNAIFVLLPTGQAILAIAANATEGLATDGALQVLEGREAVFGAINIALCLAAVFLGVIRPGFGKAAS